MDWSSSTGRGLRIGGHRGAPDVAPENTFSSFEAAVAAGADYVEMDVQRSADGTLIIIHDASLERTTNGTGAVAQTQLTDMLRLDAGSWFGEGFASQRMPTFAEFMSWVEARAPFGAVIEAKAAGVGADIAQAIGHSPAREHLAICSFRSAEIQAAKEAQPEVPCVLLFHLKPPSEDPLALIRACRADGADVPWQWLNEDLSARMHQAGFLVGGGTADDEQAVNRLLAVNADFVDSNHPSLTVRARDAGSVAR